MNGYERIRAALEGKPADRVPVMLHNFLMAAREAGHSQRRFRENPAAIAGSFIQAVETYGYDGIVVDVDTVTVAEALGVRADHPEDQPARWASRNARHEPSTTPEASTRFRNAGSAHNTAWSSTLSLIHI